MILFPENGRLGNQLFQYCGLKQCLPNQKIVFFGFDDLRSICCTSNTCFFGRKYFGSPNLFKLFRALLLFLCRFRILGRISEVSSFESYQLLIRQGLLFNLYVPDDIFFQHCNILSSITNPPLLNPSPLDTAHAWLATHGLDPIADNLVFVHIRRGDYLYWPSRHSPAVLGLSWYLKAIQHVKKSFPHSTFVLMGDDSMYLDDIVGLTPGCLVSHNSLQIDFMLMTLFRHGILSASSFAWWGAKYAGLRYRSDSHYFAPKYWIGHRSKSWFPPFMKCSSLIYLE